MSGFTKLAQQMRSDWDRRISHDYRFWMSDGYADDTAMWLSGARDFNILTKGLERSRDRTLLDLGCGVGRLLREASAHYGQVIGIDVSQEAISKAQGFLHQSATSATNVSLHVGNGVDLQPVPSGSVDVVVSFAAISSIPTEIIANYLREIHRVLTPQGVARLQLYVGTEQCVRKDDTLHLRCYTIENLKKALVLAGLELEGTAELILPIQVSFKEIGIEAVIASIRRSERVPASADDIARALLTQGEPEEGESALGNDLEYWMSLNYARELAEKGDLDRARETLDYAGRVAHTTAIDVSDLMQRIVSRIEAGDAKKQVDRAPVTTSPQGSSFNTPPHKSAIDQFFPKAAAIVNALCDGDITVEVRHTLEGPAIFCEGVSLDHPTKPRAAALQWAKQVMADDKYSSSDELVILGLGGGYHLEALRELRCEKRIHVLEPNPSVVKAALECRDPSWLSMISSLEVGPDAQLPEASRNYEIWTRPQLQATAPDFCTKVRSAFYGERGLSLLRPNIGVLGPLSGGTLPMVPYVCRALFGLDQRFREYDVSGFSSGYDYVGKFVSDKGRRGSVEGTYCEMVSQVLLESINEKPVDILICMALAPISPRVLTELRKRGVITVLWFVEDYARFTYWKDMAKFYDFVFTIQKGKCIEAIRAAGAGEVHYLPVGCDPGIHVPLKLSAEEKQRWGSPISFMGAGYHNRQQLFASLADHPMKIWGTEWPTCRPFDRMVQEGGRRLTPAEYVNVFNASDININLHSSHERDGVDPFGDFLNPRTFELAAAGVFQLVDHRSLLSESFDIGSEMATFRSGAELREKIGYYLAHPEERVKLASAARTRALKDHTYKVRLHNMLSTIYSSRYEQLKQKLNASPWNKVLARAKPHEELHARCEKAFRRGEEPNLDGLVSDIVTGEGKLSETEQKLMFLYHVRKQIIRMREEESSGKN